MTEIYISTDIEADGPIPGEYSMLSLGSVAIGKNGKILGKFYEKLKRFPKAKQHPQTIEWWKQNSEAYKEATSETKPTKEVMNKYADWLEEISRKYKKILYFLAYPSTWDFMFVSWYLIKFVERYEKNHFLDIPFHHQGIDIRTFSMAQLKKPYSESGIENMPKEWLENNKTNKIMEHNAFNDALKQGLVFIKMLRENQGENQKVSCVSPRTKVRGLFETFGCPRIHPRLESRGSGRIPKEFFGPENRKLLWFLQNPWHKK